MPQDVNGKKVTKWPLFRFYPGNGEEAEDYAGSLDDFDAITEFLTEHMVSHVASLSPVTTDQFMVDHVSSMSVILFNEESTPDMIYKALSMKYKGKAGFGWISNPPADVRKRFNLVQLPRVMFFLSQNKSAEVRRIRAWIC